MNSILLKNENVKNTIYKNFIYIRKRYQFIDKVQILKSKIKPKFNNY